MVARRRCSFSLIARRRHRAVAGGRDVPEPAADREPEGRWERREGGGGGLLLRRRWRRGRRTATEEEDSYWAHIEEHYLHLYTPQPACWSINTCPCAEQTPPFRSGGYVIGPYSQLRSSWRSEVPQGHGEVVAIVYENGMLHNIQFIKLKNSVDIDPSALLLILMMYASCVLFCVEMYIFEVH